MGLDDTGPCEAPEGHGWNGDHVCWPKTDEAWCAWYKGMDAKYDTPSYSPTHHDARCPIHTNRRNINERKTERITA